MTVPDAIPITTHVLDTALGAPARGLRVVLERTDTAGGRATLGVGLTDDHGRLGFPLPAGRALDVGTYHLTFDVGAYARAGALASFYPEVRVTFRIEDVSQHYHIPLLLSPYGYSTYRGG